MLCSSQATAAEDKNNSCFDTMVELCTVTPFSLPAQVCTRCCPMLTVLTAHYASNWFVYFLYKTQQSKSIHATSNLLIRCILITTYHGTLLNSSLSWTAPLIPKFLPIKGSLFYLNCRFKIWTVFLDVSVTIQRLITLMMLGTSSTLFYGWDRKTMFSQLCICNYSPKFWFLLQVT